MHNSAHPVEVLREWLSEGMTVTEAAKELQVSRVTFSKVLNGKADVTSGVGLRLSVWLSTSPDVWFGMQTQWDLVIIGRTSQISHQHKSQRCVSKSIFVTRSISSEYDA